MKKITEYFDQEQIELLSEIGVELRDDHDYIDDELIEIHAAVTDHYMDEGFDNKGNPTEKAKIFESIIDLFYDKFDI